MVTRSIRMRQGARLRRMRDEDGELVGGQYELHNDLGSIVRLVLVDGERWKPGSDAWATTSRIGPGTHRSSDPIHPGRYRLVLLSRGDPNRSVPLELRAGAYEDVDVTLSR